MSNVGIISDWHSKEERGALFRILRRGDLVEFDRGSYCHWAVYVGHLPTEDPVDDDLIVYEHTVVHMANPAAGETEGGRGSGAAAGSISPSSSFSAALGSSASKSASSGESICSEKLLDVWVTGLARINNGFDREMPPLDPEEVVDRAMHSVGNPTGLQRLPYNVLTNNCEHFATYVRNGWGVSAQVGRVLRKVGRAAAVVGVALVPRPLLLAVGAGYLAHQVMTQERRRTEADEDEDGRSGGDGTTQEFEDNPANVYRPD